MRKLVALLSLGAVTALALTAVSLAATHGASWSTKLTVAQEVPTQAVADTAASATTAPSDSSATSFLTFSSLSLRRIT